MNFNNKQITILGAGLLGKLLAWRLSLMGFSIHIVERSGQHSPQSAAYVAAGMIAPLTESVVATLPIYQLGLKSLALWPLWMSELPEKIFFQQNGSLVLWHPRDKYLAQDFLKYLRHISLTAAEIWDSNALKIKEPQLYGRFIEGIYLPQEGQIDGRQLLMVLGDWLSQQKHITCHWNYEGDLSKEMLLNSQMVFDVRGVGSKNSWNQLNHSILRGVRGEVLRLFCPEVELSRPVRLLHPHYQIYIAPKENHLFVVGATEIETEDSSSISVKSVLELLSALQTVHPAFLEARVIESNTQLRPTLNHHLPEILIKDDKFVYINGLSRHGYLLAPAVIDILIRGCILDTSLSDEEQQIISKIE